MIVVGCPVKDRAWAMGDWFEHVQQACDVAGQVPYFVFVGNPVTDPSTFAAIDSGLKFYNHGASFVTTHESSNAKYKRVWNQERYMYMVGLRNELLGKVRELGPDLFWSVDSDILVARNTLESAMEALERFDAVGSRCYLTQAGVATPNQAIAIGEQGMTLERQDGAECVEVAAIMALKLMTPRAYHVDYEMHRQGEDIGWSVAARRKGLVLGWDGRTVSKHLRDRSELGRFDSRVGF